LGTARSLLVALKCPSILKARDITHLNHVPVAVMCSVGTSMLERSAELHAMVVGAETMARFGVRSDTFALVAEPAPSNQHKGA
jgi:uncharacterized membrane protein